MRTGAIGNKVRVLDGRISGADAVDVISILSEAAKAGPRECLSPAPAPVVTPDPPRQVEPEKPKVVTPPVQVVERPKVVTPPVVTPPKPLTPEPEAEKTRKKGGWSLGDLRRRVANLLSENLYEDDDE